jgi:hypothetical protein
MFKETLYLSDFEDQNYTATRMQEEQGTYLRTEKKDS